jgi:predicted GH43/DUF377 family glycosyl hydrolase
MTARILFFVMCIGVVGRAAADPPPSRPATDSSNSPGGWKKYSGNPVLGGQYGTCFDVCVLKEGDSYRMWLSWRPKASIALVESNDGIHWTKPRIVLGPRKETGWEDDINRPIVLKRGDGYHLWYTGQAKGHSWIGYATSPDGISWKRMSDKPVLSPEKPWEKVAVMCPHVLWDEQAKNYRMWYSGGEQNEPNSIGYATSPEGLTWTKHAANPIFTPDKRNDWEKDRVTACQVIRQGDWYIMFYIGFRDEATAQIGIARSRDGVTNWQRHAANPIVRRGKGEWDADACYKPFAVFDGKQWLLWYNGRRGGFEQIGLAIHEGEDLGFERTGRRDGAQIVPPYKLRRYVEMFNKNDEELYRQYVPNADAEKFLEENIPLLDCSDADIEQAYYFRWWTYRKHIKQTSDGFVITEFLPAIPWAGEYNTISCAVGHHFYEGRWLRDAKYLDDYARFWFRKGSEPRRYSCWLADAIWARYLVTGQDDVIRHVLLGLVPNYMAWELSNRDASGLFWQEDGRDGMEVSIGGSGLRATINSYMYGDAMAIAKMAEHFDQHEIAAQFRDKAAEIKRLTQEKLWDKKAQFFKVVARSDHAAPADVRELHGYTPWYFNLPDADKAVAWNQLMDPKGFFAPFGPTTAEQRHPKFAVSYLGHECQWNGPSWPYATAVTLTAMANFLNGPEQNAVTRGDYFKLLKIYAKSQHLKREDGTIVPWIDENLNPFTGDWLSRTRLKSWNNGHWDVGKGGVERGKDYNHSTFCDLVISGLIGLRPRADDVVEINPLLPEGTWDYFCLDRVSYHGRDLAILYDKTGLRYGKGKGLRLFADGREIAAADGLRRIEAKLPPRRQ